MACSVANPLLELPPEYVIFGHSEAMSLVRSNIERLAGTNVPILIRGESGTGKEIVAQIIHCRSPWAAGPFLKISCPAITGTEIQNELFAEGADALAAAGCGTVFLDEVSELAVPLQVRLLQLLQDHQFCRIRTDHHQHVDVRVICSTSRDLQEEVNAGNFRQDLFYRINVMNLALPALRDRLEDVPELATYFFEVYREKYNCPVRPLSARAMRLLQTHHWPGNVRELENLIKRYVILGSEDVITGDLANRTGNSHLAEIPADGIVPLKKVARQAAREVERQVILRSLQANNWNRKRVARALSISYRALLYKIREAGIGPVPGRRSRHRDSSSVRREDAA